jgi:hypothetical protein
VAAIVAPVLLLAPINGRRSCDPDRHFPSDRDFVLSRFITSYTHAACGQAVHCPARHCAAGCWLAGSGATSRVPFRGAGQVAGHLGSVIEVIVAELRDTARVSKVLDP